jgi:hypothetical protein
MDFVVVSLFKLLCVQVLCIQVFEMGTIYIYELSFALLLLCFVFNGFHSMSKRSCSPKFQHPHESVGESSNESTIKT